MGLFDFLLEWKLQELVNVLLSGTLSFLITPASCSRSDHRPLSPTLSSMPHGELPCFINISVHKYDWLKKIWKYGKVHYYLFIIYLSPIHLIDSFLRAECSRSLSNVNSSTCPVIVGLLLLSLCSGEKKNPSISPSLKFTIKVNRSDDLLHTGSVYDLFHEERNSLKTNFKAAHVYLQRLENFVAPLWSSWYRNQLKFC